LQRKERSPKYTDCGFNQELNHRTAPLRFLTVGILQPGICHVEIDVTATPTQWSSVGVAQKG
jgi:hypothetical protein